MSHSWNVQQMNKHIVLPNILSKKIFLFNKFSEPKIGENYNKFIKVTIWHFTESDFPLFYIHIDKFNNLFILYSNYFTDKLNNHLKCHKFEVSDINNVTVGTQNKIYMNKYFINNI